MSELRTAAPRRRIARLSLLAAALAGLCVVMLGLAVWFDQRGGRGDGTVRLPVGISYNVPAATFVTAALVALAAVLVGFAALESAAAVRVLARDRRIPAPLPVRARAARRLLLSGAGEAVLELDRDPDVPPSLLPGAGSADEAAARAVRLTVLVPAHDEAATIATALRSLADQTRRPDRVVVVADNCTDDTAAIARSLGADVVSTVGNTEKKAGALNQALAGLLPGATRQDAILVMDADTVIVPGYLAEALARMEADPALIAVGGVFYGEDGAGLLGQLQRNEFTRYQRHISRRRGKVYVLTGTASVFRAYALRAVAEARGSLIPGPPGLVYDTLALTEDNEMTLALKTLGARMVSPMQCRTVTEVMPTWRALWRQRMRWQRGALENIGAYGLTRTTALYWLQQLGIGYGTIALNAYLVLMLVTLLAADGVEIMWFWAAVGLIFLAERLVTVWAAGWRGRAIAAPLVVELAYDWLLQVVFVKSLIDIATGRAAGWNHVAREESRA